MVDQKSQRRPASLGGVIPPDWLQPKQEQDNELKEVIAEIQAMIGLQDVKAQLLRLIAFANVSALRRKRNLQSRTINLHMVFLGPPGTGKTEIARKIGRMLKALGLLKKGHVVEVDRSRLVGAYVGQTESLVKDAVQEALGGVLFIDEAYTLSSGADKFSGPDQYGRKALEVLLKYMEDYRDRLVIIAAGYKSEMRHFLEANPGLRSRFSLEIDFPSYDAEELSAIFDSMVRSAGFSLTPEAQAEARQYIAEISQSADEHFGNAREVRTFFEQILPAQAMRFLDMAEEEVSDEALVELTLEDVRAAAALSGM